MEDKELILRQIEEGLRYGDYEDKELYRRL